MLNFEYHAAVPGIRAALETTEEILWWGRRDNVITIPGVIDGSARWHNATADQEILPAGLLMGKILATGKLKQWDPTAVDGTERIYGVLLSDQKMQAQGVDLDRWRGFIMVAGPMKPTGFHIHNTLAAGINAHAFELLIRAQMNKAIFDDEPQGNLFGGWLHIVDKTASFTAVENDNNTLFTNLAATGTVVVTLPAPRHGYRIGVFVAAGNSIVLKAAAGTPIICEGDATRSEIELAPNIGAMIEILGKDASNYIANVTHPASGGGAGGGLAGNRYRLSWVAGAQGVPAANADVASDTGATAAIADRDFEIGGTNATTGDVTVNAEGGVTMQTDGATSDQEILTPHLDTNQSAWTGVTWGLDQEIDWECRIRTAGTVPTLTDTEVFAGLKLTNDPSIATDANQVYFFYSDAHGSITANWIAVTGAPEDAETDTGVALAADTDYHLRITVDAARIVRFYINGELVHTSAALTSADLIPYIGIEDIGAGAAKSLIVRGQDISRNAA